MTKRALFRNIGPPLLVLALFWGLISLRAMPAMFRGSYTTEGGEWLSTMWRIGFWKSISVIRPDYCVFGNLVVLQLSEWVNAVLHGANMDRAPMIQHHLSSGYVAAMFTIIYSLLRRSHGLWSSLFVCLSMLMVPDLDDENRIFGEATNLGYFSALVVLFVFYDLWLNPQASFRRLVCYGLLVAFHIATSPMAGIITVAWSGLFAVRSLMNRSLSKKPLFLLLSPLILFALFTIIRAQKSGPTAMPTDMAVFKHSFVEIVLARQLLYPLITNVFVGFSDRATLIVFTALIAAIGWFAWLEWNHEKRNWQRLTGTLVIFGAAIGMALATAYTRQWIYLHEAHYASLWPARYYIAQNMAAAAFMALMLVRLCELRSTAQTLVLMFAAMMGTNYAMQQTQKTGRYLAQDDPHIVARWWPYQMRRVHAVQALVGDRNAAIRKPDSNLFYTMEINIDRHHMQMSVDQIEKAVATPLAAKPDSMPLAFVDSSAMKAEDKGDTRAFRSQDLRIIPRSDGMLVSFDLGLDGLPLFDNKRRKLWLGKITGDVKGLAFAYEMPKSERSISEMRKDRKPQNRLFKVYLHFKGEQTIESIRQQLSGLPCAIGETPGSYLAATTVLSPGERPCLAAISGDEAFALRLHPLKTNFNWDGSTKEIKLTNCSTKGAQFSLKPASPEDFDEAAYLQNNPDIADAVAKHVVPSGKAYVETLGRDESRQFSHYGVTIPVTTSLATADIAGLRIQITRGQGPLPPTITCVLHGDGSQATSIRLCPAEGETTYETYFLPRTWTSSPHPVHSLELQFEGVGKESRAFTIDEVKLYSH